MKRLRANEVKAMITPKQAAETLMVNASTVRRWANEFEPFLSPRKGTKRQYTVDDLAMFRRIKDYYSQGMNTSQVKEALGVVDRISPNDKALINISDFALAFEQLNLDNIQLQKQINEQGAAIEALKAELSELKRPWYQKLLGKR